MSSRVLFIDRDGTLIAESPDEQIDSLEKLDVFQHAIQGLSRIAKLGYELVMVTNQDGLGTAAFPEESFWPAHSRMLEILKEQAGVSFQEVLIDRSFMSDDAPTRKPRTGLVGRYLSGGCDLKNSYVIGDRLTDMELAKNMGCRGILLTTRAGQDDPKKIRVKGLQEVIAVKAGDWLDIADYLEKINNVRRTC